MFVPSTMWIWMENIGCSWISPRIWISINGEERFSHVLTGLVGRCGSRGPLKMKKSETFATRSRPHQPEAEPCDGLFSRSRSGGEAREQRIKIWIKINKKSKERYLGRLLLNLIHIFFIINGSNYQFMIRDKVNHQFILLCSLSSFLFTFYVLLIE